MSLVGALREKGAVNQITLCFPGDSVSLSEVVEAGLSCFNKQGRPIDRDYLMLALDGRVLPQHSWEGVGVADGQVCTLFTPLSGG